MSKLKIEVLQIENTEKIFFQLAVFKNFSLVVPIMHSADQTKIENQGLLQGTALAVLCFLIIALVDMGYPK